MNWNKPHAALGLGSEIVELLIPQRRPFLMVDEITAFLREPTPALRTRRLITANDPVFAGHFPNLHLWPGVFTIEGLGQTCNLLYVISMLQLEWRDEGGDPDDVLDALRNLHLGYRMQPGFDPGASETLVARLGHASFIAFSAAVNIKLTRPVFAGQMLEYQSVVEHVVGDMARFRVEATVNNQIVASGSMTSHRGPVTLPNSPPHDA